MRWKKEDEEEEREKKTSTSMFTSVAVACRQSPLTRTGSSEILKRSLDWLRAEIQNAKKKLGSSSRSFQRNGIGRRRVLFVSHF